MPTKSATLIGFTLAALIFAACGQVAATGRSEFDPRAATKMTGRLKLEIQHRLEQEDDRRTITVLIEVADAAMGGQLLTEAGMKIGPGSGKIIRGEISIERLLGLLADDLIISADLAGKMRSQGGNE